MSRKSTPLQSIEGRQSSRSPLKKGEVIELPTVQSGLDKERRSPRRKRHSTKECSSEATEYPPVVIVEHSAFHRMVGGMLSVGAILLLSVLGGEEVRARFPHHFRYELFGPIGGAFARFLLAVLGVTSYLVSALLLLLGSTLYRRRVRLKRFFTLCAMTLTGSLLLSFLVAPSLAGRVGSAVGSFLFARSGPGGVITLTLLIMAFPLAIARQRAPWSLVLSTTRMFVIALRRALAGLTLSFLRMCRRGYDGIKATCAGCIMCSERALKRIFLRKETNALSHFRENGELPHQSRTSVSLVTQPTAQEENLKKAPLRLQKPSLFKMASPALDKGPPSSRVVERGSYQPPPLEFFARDEPLKRGSSDEKELLALRDGVKEKLREFKVDGEVVDAVRGPVITLVEFSPAPGVKVGRVSSLSDDLKLALKAQSVRIVAPLPGKSSVGIEVPNLSRDIVRLRKIIESDTFSQRPSSDLMVAIGVDTYGEPVALPIASMPHLLIAGATGTGKSVCINTLLLSLLQRCPPSELGLILIDPKILELSVYAEIPHLMVPVVTVAKQSKAVLSWAVTEMDRRYRLMQEWGVRNIDSYNDIVRGTTQSPKKSAREAKLKESPIAGKTLETLPKIVIVIDELADLMFQVGRDIEELITRLAQKARAAGIHLIVATQRPSVDVITGLIKANFPARLSFRVTSRVDSRTILDSMGAESLLGKGDMLIMQPGAQPLKRVHGAFVSDEEVNAFVENLKERYEPRYDPTVLSACEEALSEESEGVKTQDSSDLEYDVVYDKAVEFVIEKKLASTSMIQRAFRIGYNRAARIIDMMERDGVVGPMDGVKPREVLVKNQENGEV
jgi:DNA polymerase III delta prime subunit